MLKIITLQKTACYGEPGQALSPLKTVNIIYGENGCGKSTIARLIKESSKAEFSQCNIEWDLSTPLKAYVYDKDFIEETLRETTIKGVFTLGKESSDATVMIDEKKLLKHQIELKLKSLSEQIAEKETSKSTEHTLLEEKCWDIKKRYENIFSPAFKGLNRSKSQFTAKCIESINNDHTHTHDDLQKKVIAIFASNVQKIIPLPAMDTGDLVDIEKSDIFKLRIVGKEDIPIAGIINKLESSDWVRRGLGYFVEDVCPFCQQKVSFNLREQLSSYFDELYSQKIDDLERQSKRYFDTAISIVSYLESLANYNTEYFKFDTIRPLIAAIISKIDKNKVVIDGKRHEPSTSIMIDSISQQLSEITEIINTANTKIADYNSTIDNLAKEKALLINNIWEFIGNELHDTYIEYQTRVRPITLALDGMRRKVSQLTSDIGKLVNDILELEKTITSTTPSKEGINSILSFYGFNNFTIVESGTGYYKIQRSDGSPAGKTLSEGERTFITFLYFYQLIQGSVSRDDVESPRIIVFDDPVSSLDSKILFIVSTLIRSLFSKNELMRLNIKQIFILTHNVYFHREVTFAPSLKYLGDTHLTEKDFTYWIVRKKSGSSFLTYYQKNPIKTNYQLLWQEVKNYETNPATNITICNVLRRILENYFRILGGIDLNDLSENFDGAEKLVVRSLTSWINDGSHFAFDSMDISSGDILAEDYLQIFKKIFDVTEHSKHYEMMMNMCS